MHPEKEWNSWVEYDETLASLAIEFTENFKNKFKGQLGEDEEQIVNAGPSILWFKFKTYTVHNHASLFFQGFYSFEGTWFSDIEKLNYLSEKREK